MTPELTAPELTTTAPARPRVLYLTHRVPYPPDKGDRIRNFHLLRALARFAEVSLACLADEPVADGTRAVLDGLARRVAIVPVTRVGRGARAGLSLVLGKSLSEGAFDQPALARVIEDWQRDWPADAVVVSASSLVPYLDRLRGVPAFVDLVDVDSQKWLDFAETTLGPRRWLYQLEARRVRKMESRLPGSVRAIALVSRAEADLYDSFAGNGAATVATNGVDLDYFAPAATPTVSACAFVGALDYRPNVDAATWFAREVWPAIRQKHPYAEFWLIGRQPARSVLALGLVPGVRVVGPVADVRPHLARAAVVVAPMRLARGLQNKVLEALAMAKATVASPPALAALGAVPGRDLLTARTPQEWTDAVSLLLDDADLRAALGQAGRRYVEVNHHWDRCLAPLTDSIRAVCRQ